MRCATVCTVRAVLDDTGRDVKRRIETEVVGTAGNWVLWARREAVAGAPARSCARHATTLPSQPVMAKAQR